MKKKIIVWALALVLAIGIIVPIAFAAPKDKISADKTFMSIFTTNPELVKTEPYVDGQKAKVAISSNSHYADYAKEGFWFVWGGDKDLGEFVSAKQKDTGFAVLADFFFDKYESATITVKSSNVYKSVTFTEPGTYFVDKFLLKNEGKGEAGGYHNINWIGVELTPIPDDGELETLGSFSIEKWVNGEFIFNWYLKNAEALSKIEKLDVNHDDIVDINDFCAMMTFELWTTDGEGGEAIDWIKTVRLGESGLIDFGGDISKGTYLIIERLTPEGAAFFGEVEPLYIEYDGSIIYAPAEVELFSGKHTSGMAEVSGEFYMPEQKINILEQWDGGIGNTRDEDGIGSKFGRAKWIWDVEDPAEQYGESGKVIKVDIIFNIHSEILDDKVFFKFAADNAAVVYVNNDEVPFAYTWQSMRFEYNNQVKPYTAFGDLEFKDFDGYKWNVVYDYYDIKPLLKQGENKITVYAANSKKTTGTGTVNDTYTTKNNPGGLIYYCTYKTDGVKFDNTTIETNLWSLKEGTLDVALDLDIQEAYKTQMHKDVADSYNDSYTTKLGDFCEVLDKGKNGEKKGDTLVTLDQDALESLRNGKTLAFEIATRNENNYSIGGYHYYYYLSLKGDNLVVTIDEDIISLDCAVRIFRVKPDSVPNSGGGSVIRQGDEFVVFEGWKEKGKDTNFVLSASDEILYLYFHGSTMNYYKYENGERICMIDYVTEVDYRAFEGEYTVEVSFDGGVTKYDITSEEYAQVLMTTYADGTEVTVIVYINGVEYDSKTLAIIAGETVTFTFEVQHIINPENPTLECGCEEIYCPGLIA